MISSQSLACNEFSHIFRQKLYHILEPHKKYTLLAKLFVKRDVLQGLTNIGTH